MSDKNDDRTAMATARQEMTLTMMARACWTATTSLTTMVTTGRVTIDDYKDGAAGDDHDDDGDGATGNNNNEEDNEDHNDRGGKIWPFNDDASCCWLLCKRSVHQLDRHIRTYDIKHER